VIRGHSADCLLEPNGGLNMREIPNPSLGAETIRRVASEQVRMALAPAEVDALKTLLNSLFEEIGHVTPRDRGTTEPETGVTVEDWPQ
jgi:hypothetical protein